MYDDMYDDMSEDMSEPTYPITGIPLWFDLDVESDPYHKIPNAIPLRLEINEWFDNPENEWQVSLFVRALSFLMQMDPDDKLSYWQIAGIHGYPWHSWDGVPPDSFCVHNSPTFPTWHRIYLVLLEKRLYEIMIGIIEPSECTDSNFIERHRWETAASKWRLPYWDWASSPSIPHMATMESVEILVPYTNRKEVVANPLWQFKNPTGTPMGDMGIPNWISDDIPFHRCVATSRYGILNGEIDPEEEWIHGVQRWRETTKALRNPRWSDGDQISISDAVYRMFSPGYIKSWEEFASTKANPTQPRGSNFLSLEQIHNDLHMLIGGTNMNTLGAGHMSVVAVAAFDPLFWLHHCNIDRYVAVWQYLNPDDWFHDPSEDDPQPSDSLLPFHKDVDGSTWSSDMVKDWRKLNYEYDIMRTEPREDRYEEECILKINQTVNRVYGQTRGDVLSCRLNIDGCSNDYVLNVVYDRYGLNGEPYIIYFFLGPRDSEIALDAQQASYIGSVYTFSSRLAPVADSDCTNCRKQKASGTLSRAQIPLTSQLLRRAQDPEVAGINSLELQDVNQYLVRNLNWRVSKMSGQEVLIDALPRTNIYVLNGTADHYADDSKLSTYQNYNVMSDPCHGKPGGLNVNEGPL